jgi:hypothetical protein
MFTCEERVGPKLCGASTANYPAAAGAVARRGQFAAAIIVGISVIVWAAPAAAYRPFDGTDAAVADVGEVEVELQPLGAARAGGTTRGLSDTIVNYGFADRWELVLQTTPQVPPEGFGPISVSNAALLKYVVQPGVLQEKSGPSIATEFGALLPAIGGSGVGASWTGIVSQRWDWGTVHFNLAANLTPDQHAEVFVDTIIEGPHKWEVRPVAEFYFDNVFNGEQTYSALVGAIWQVNDKLSFDVAVRYALVDGRPVSEFRAGLTFGFPLNFGKPSSAQMPNPALIGRR